MRCEVCGREILGQPQRRVIEGAKLTVCGRCAAFGKTDWSPTRTVPVGPAPVPLGQRPLSAAPRAPRPPRNDVDTVEQSELVEDYGAQIRKARQRLGLTEKDLAMKMQEKESVVKKLEKEELTPDNRMISKIRRVLGINLVERVEGSKSGIIAKPTGPKTIGDVLKLETEKEEKS